MKISRKQLRKLINETVNESDGSQSDAMTSAYASIEKQFGKGSIVKSGSGDKLSNDWMRFVMRNPRYQETLLHVWDHLIDGDDPKATKQIYLNDLDGNTNIANAITFYGRRVSKNEQYLTGDQIKVKIEAERAQRAQSAEDRKNAPPKQWKRPDYGMGTRIDPDTGEEIAWTGTYERFN